jgi:hypothetical protein
VLPQTVAPEPGSPLGIRYPNTLLSRQPSLHSQPSHHSVWPSGSSQVSGEPCSVETTCQPERRNHQAVLDVPISSATYSTYLPCTTVSVSRLNSPLKCTPSHTHVQDPLALAWILLGPDRRVAHHVHSIIAPPSFRSERRTVGQQGPAHFSHCSDSGKVHRIRAPEQYSAVPPALTDRVPRPARTFTNRCSFCY